MSNRNTISYQCAKCGHIQSSSNLCENCNDVNETRFLSRDELKNMILGQNEWDTLLLISKAQDAKTLKWLDEPCKKHPDVASERLGESVYYPHRKDCPECWKELNIEKENL